MNVLLMRLVGSYLYDSRRPLPEDGVIHAAAVKTVNHVLGQNAVIDHAVVSAAGCLRHPCSGNPIRPESFHRPRR